MVGGLLGSRPLLDPSQTRCCSLRSPVLPNCSCTMCGGLVWPVTRAVHTCAAAVQYCLTFVCVRRGLGYAQRLSVLCQLSLIRPAACLYQIDSWPPSCAPSTSAAPIEDPSRPHCTIMVCEVLWPILDREITSTAP